jgi:uncharacterized protein (TIGR03437 family)
MDAAYTTLKKAVLFLSFALISLGFWSSPANAQSPAIVACSPITTNFQGVSGVPCAVSSTSGSISFNSSVSYSPAAPTQAGWLSVDPSQGTIPDTVQTVQLTLRGIAGLVSGNTYTATVTLTPTSPANATGTTITLTFTYGSTGGGGGGTGAIAASPTSLTFCQSGCLSTQSITLSTTSATAIPFTITSVPAWLGISGSANSVSSGSPAVFSVYVLSFSGAASTSLTVSYNNTSISVPIYFTGSGGGNGIISPNPSTVTFCYNTGSTVPTSTINFTDSSNPSLFQANASVTSGDPSWLWVAAPGNFAGGAISYGYIAGTSFNVLLNNNVLSQLTSGTHNGSISITDYPGGNQALVNVILNVNNGGGCSAGSGSLTVNPSSLTLPSVALNSTTTVSVSTSVSSSLTGNLANPVVAGSSCTGISAYYNSTTLIGSGSPVTLTVYGSPSGISSTSFTETCYLTLNLQSGSSTIGSATLPVTWTIGSGGGTGGNASNPVLPTSVNFATEGSSSTPLTPQLVTITSAGSWTAGTPSASWITVSQSSGTSTGTSTVLISANPSGLSASTSPYTGTVTFNTAAGQQVVTVSLLNTPSSPVLYANQTTGFSLQAISGSIVGSSNPFQVLASDGSSIAFTVSSSATWIVTSPSSGNTTNNSVVSFSINPANLANGVYYGNIVITAGAAANSPLNIPVVLTVSGSSSSGGTGSLTFTPTTLTFNAQVSGTAPAAQAISVSDPAGISYYAAASGTNNGITWLFVSPSVTYVAGSQSFNVTVNQTGLPLGTYTGTVSFYDTSGNSQSVSVTMNVTTTGGGSGTVTSSPTSLTFNANQGGSVPATQPLTITSTATSFTVTTTEQNGTAYTWLSASTSGNTVTVSVNQANLTAGTYNGAVVITPAGGTALSVPITLVVTGLPVISASPTTLNLSYSVGGTAPTASVSVNGGASLSYLATVSSTCNCFAISPASGDTTTSPTITVSLTNPTSLTAGTYTGTISVAGTTNSTGNTVINVTLTVTAPLPTISAVVNAATGGAGPVSPGEIVSLFAPATNPIGPATAVALTGSVLVNGNVPTTGLGGVKVTFNGYPAAVLYASAAQVNVVVPYEVAGFSGFPVVVTYLGQNSNGFTLQTTASVPGIFTQNAAGSGPADVLNSDGVTVNGPNTPAAKGSTVSVYMTGEGATTPRGVDGAVTCNGGCSSLSQIPIPLLKVAVLVDNQPATVIFYGEAPGLVSGVMQVNFTIPPGVHSGAVSLVVSVGSSQSQSNVTINVQ